MTKTFALLGTALIVLATYLASNNREKIQWKSVGLAFLGQFILAFFLIKTPIWIGVEWLSVGVSWILDQSKIGIDFVFGGISDQFVFFLNSLLPIVFISALMGILFHLNLLQRFISIVSKCLARFLKVDTLVATNGIANMFLGQTESLFVTKSYLPQAKDNVIFATLVGGMTSISVSVVGLYASYGASMTWILISMPLTVLSTFVLTQIFMPTEYDREVVIHVENDKGVNVIETMMNYAMTGFKSVIGITVALIVFLSLVGMINNFIALFAPNLSIESILGVLFTPIAYLMGVSQEEVSLVSQILATKLVTNEAVAFALPQFSELSENVKAMMTVALCGFAGIGSIGILVGGYSAIAPNKVPVVARLGVKALLIATLVNIMTAGVVGLFL